jgi:hypothetical protein
MIELLLDVNIAKQIFVYIVERFTSELELRVFKNNKHKVTGLLFRYSWGVHEVLMTLPLGSI